MLPTSKKLEGHIASGTFVRAFPRAGTCVAYHQHFRYLSGKMVIPG